MSAAWPLEATPEDDLPLPAPWDGEFDVCDGPTESALMQLAMTQPALAVRACRRSFGWAEARGDEHAAILSLYLACMTLGNALQDEAEDRLRAVIVRRMPSIADAHPHLLIRFELNIAQQLCDAGEHAEAMVIRQRALPAAMALGDARMTLLALAGLAISAVEAGDAELTLALCEQQRQLMRADDIFSTYQRVVRGNNMAIAYQKIAQAHTTQSDHEAARVALRRAAGLALTACDDETSDDKMKLYCLGTLVEALLLLDEAAEARAHFERLTQRLAAVPSPGSELWRALETARVRIDIHVGHVGQQTIDRLCDLEATTETVTDSRKSAGDIRALMQQAYEQLGDYEKALATHKRAIQWRAQLVTTQTRQRIKMLRHTVLAMRAEAVEFIAHDLLTPLAAAQTWSQALLRDRLAPVVAANLNDAHQGLARATMLSEQYLGLLRAELFPRDRLQVLDFGALADDVCENTVASASAGLRVTRVIDIGTPVLADATLLMKALAAMLVDAFGRAPVGSCVEVRVAHNAAQGEAMLSISHEGSGPTPAARARLVRQTFDGDVLAPGQLGLALASRVCKLHRIRLRFETVKGQGSRMRWTMKLATLAPVAASSGATVAFNHCTSDVTP